MSAHTPDHADLARLIGPVARDLLGEPNSRLSSGDELRFGANGSLKVKIGGEGQGTYFDFERDEGGGVLDLVKRETGRANGEAVKWLRENGHLDRRSPRKRTGVIAATYDYESITGKSVFQVVRSADPKTFRQRRPDGNGGWLWNLEGVERVPYRLPELLKSSIHAPVFVVEGEKDVETLRAHGLIATTNPGGAGKWLPSMSKFLRDRHVVVLPDNDVAGENHAQDVATKLLGIARSIRIVRLPNLPPKGDVSDWLAAGGTAEELEQLVRESAEEPREASPGAGQKTRPSFRILTPDECEVLDPRPYVVKGLIGQGDHVVLMGQPGSGKSVLAPHIAYAVAQGRDVLGRRVKAGPVLYLACEDGHGMTMRIRALRRRRGDARNFHLVPEPLDFHQPNSTQLTEFEALVAELKPVMIVIDTLARTFPGLRENEGEDMGRVVKIARSLGTICGSAVVQVHHVAKDAGTTPRGHGSLNGDADLTALVEGSAQGQRTVSLGKNRNGASDATFAFRIGVETLGIDPDGDVITAPIAEEVEILLSDELRAKEAKLKDGPAVMLRVLRDVSTEHGKQAAPEADMPPVTCVERGALRKQLIARGWFPDSLLSNALSGDEKQPELTRAGYTVENNALRALERKGFLSFTRRLVWLR